MIREKVCRKFVMPVRKERALGVVGQIDKPPMLCGPPARALLFLRKICMIREKVCRKFVMPVRKERALGVVGQIDKP
ncbi:MAG TPA: hypothetical protein VN317_03605, partial [Candidatus Methanoperedens sp.]|nr:hypothetical protein [Candidatus Methanoperedens sp.]